MNEETKKMHYKIWGGLIGRNENARSNKKKERVGHVMLVLVRRTHLYM